ncbi:ferritin 1 heavy chain [Lycorma delicatula]|uniref:ferritin 1 heavy chain n=1 Tax=Lycorma delicatula TaxID=130591 RepID=UPI003F515862
MNSMNVIGTFLTLFLVSLPHVLSESFHCKFGDDISVIPKWTDMDQMCVKSVVRQIQTEMDASITYLVMGAHFSQDNVNLPGFAKFFFESASEEREHAIKLIKYLSMRGELTLVADLPRFPTSTKTNLVSGLAALQGALQLEVKVTNAIKNLISICEKTTQNDYHITDWLTTEYLEEQYKSQRDLAGKISTLKKLNINRSSNYTHTNVAEFIFDKKLMGIDI